jgi:hypothetical protein
MKRKSMKDKLYLIGQKSLSRQAMLSTAQIFNLKETLPNTLVSKSGCD